MMQRAWRTFASRNGLGATSERQRKMKPLLRARDDLDLAKAAEPRKVCAPLLNDCLVRERGIGWDLHERAAFRDEAFEDEPARSRFKERRNGAHVTAARDPWAKSREHHPGWLTNRPLEDPFSTHDPGVNVRNPAFALRLGREDQPEIERPIEKVTAIEPRL